MITPSYVLSLPGLTGQSSIIFSWIPWSHCHSQENDRGGFIAPITYISRPNSAIFRLGNRPRMIEPASRIILSYLYVKKQAPIFNIMRITHVLFQTIRCEAIFKINLLLADRP